MFAFRFCVAGLEVLLSSTQPDGLANLAGFYRAYPSAGRPPGLIIDIERVPGFAQGRERGPEYPAFRASLVQPGTIALSRFDAEGQVTVPGLTGGHDGEHDSDHDAEPVRARFRVADSANSLEAAIRIGMSIALPRLGGLILHASALAAGNRALIFAGKSGAGKSTLAAMLASPGLPKLADELIILKPEPAGGQGAQCWHAHVTPFIGSGGLPHGTHLPMGGIHFLVQAPHHRRTALPRTEALRELLRHVLVYVAEPQTAARVLAAAAQLVAQVPCYRLEFAKDPQVAAVLDIT